MCVVEIVSRVRRGDLTAHARLALRHDRETEPGHEDALVEQQFAHLDRRSGLAHDDRNDRRLARERREARLHDALAVAARVGDPVLVRPGRGDPSVLGL